MSQLLWYPGHEQILEDIVRAENCHLFDSMGRKYVDLEAGVWCTSVGHANPRILKAISDQASRIAHTGFAYSTPVVEEVTREILSLTGLDGGRCVFLCSGSEAVEYGVRVAQSLIEQPLMMTMTDSYFGAYGSASMKRKDEWFLFDWTPCADCPDTIECDERCENWAAIPFQRIGGFLFEPGSSSGLVRFPPETLVKRIVETIKKIDGFVIVNEVTTGIGRTGRWFGYQHYGIKPDIVAMGKGIGNGYPVSVTAFAPRVMDRLGNRPVNYAQSHQNDPLGAVVAREVIQIIREDRLIEKSLEAASLLVAGLDEIMSRNDRIKEIRARGSMVAIELNDDPQASLTIKVHRKLVERGFVVGRRPGISVLRLDPSLTIEQEDIERFLKTFDRVIEL